MTKPEITKNISTPTQPNQVKARRTDNEHRWRRSAQNLGGQSKPRPRTRTSGEKLRRRRQPQSAADPAGENGLHGSASNPGSDLFQILGFFAEPYEVSHIFTAHGSITQIVAWFNERSSAQDTLIGLGATSSRRNPAFVNRNVSLEAGRFPCPCLRGEFAFSGLGTSETSTTNRDEVVLMEVER